MLKKILRPISRILFKIWFNFEIFGKKNIPKKGAIIIAPNHISNVDAVVIGSALQRETKFIAKEELFRIRWFKNLIITLGAFSIEKKKIKESLYKCLKILENKQALVYFPEGTRSKTGKLREGLPGIGMIAYKSKTDIIPTCIFGTNRVLPVGGIFPRPNKIIIKFGEPIKIEKFLSLPSSKQTFKLIVDKVMEEIRKLQNAS